MDEGKVSHLANNSRQEQFNQERRRLLTTLGEVVEGGIVHNLQHIGATSVPQLMARSGIDIGLAIWPFPLPSPSQAALEGLGYELVAGYEGAPEQRFRHSKEDFRLYLVEPGDERWADYLILRDYLRKNGAGRQRYLAHKQAWAGVDPEQSGEARAAFFEQMLEVARAWWIEAQGFGPVEAVAQELEAYGCPWYISSGWALDLFLGRVSRVHLDIDIVVRRADQLDLQQHLAGRGWKLATPLQGQLQPWPVAMRLELPRHQVHAHREDAFIDFLLTDIEQGVWRYRREPTIIQTVERLGLQTEDGIPYLAPEIILLFKSKNTGHKERSKDEADFQRVAPHLPPERRTWLRWVLLAIDPGHPWIGRLV